VPSLFLAQGVTRLGLSFLHGARCPIDRKTEDRSPTLLSPIVANLRRTRRVSGSPGHALRTCCPAGRPRTPKTPRGLRRPGIQGSTGYPEAPRGYPAGRAGSSPPAAGYPRSSSDGLFSAHPWGSRASARPAKQGTGAPPLPTARSVHSRCSPRRHQRRYTRRRRLRAVKLRTVFRRHRPRVRTLLMPACPG
jgi:hypothetical protein